MNWPGWMENNVWQWLAGIAVGVIGIVVSVILALRTKHPAPQGSTIKGDRNIQIINSSDVNITTKVTDPEERSKQDTILQNTEENKQVLKRIQEQLGAKKIEAESQLISKLENKIQELEKELELRAHTTEDKRTEEASIAFKDGNYEKAKLLFETLRKEGTEKEAELARISYNLGNVYFVELDFQMALETYLDAVRLAPDDSIYLNEAGYAYYKLAQYNKAIEYYDMALKSGLNTFGEAHPNVAIYLNNLGEAWREKGKHGKAIEYYEKALKSGLNTFGEAHPNVVACLNNLGEAWREKGKYDKAIEYYEKALKSGLITFGEAHPNVSMIWNNLGLAWYSKDDHNKAIEYYEKSLKSSLNTFGEEHPNVAICWNNLGMVWSAKGYNDKAIEYYEKALKSDLNTFDEFHPNVAREWNNLGAAWVAKGYYDKAIEYYEKALVILKSTLGDEHPNVKITERSINWTKSRHKL